MTGSWGLLGCFWGLLGRSWGLLEPLGALLGDLGALLGGSWGLLSASWEPLGASWAPLRPTWRRSKTTQKQHVKTKQFPTQHGTTHPKVLGSQSAPKIDQNRTQNEAKIKTMFKSEKVGHQEPLGAVLGRSWAVLGVILGSEKAFWYWNSYYESKIIVFAKNKLSRRVLDPT